MTRRAWRRLLAVGLGAALAALPAAALAYETTWG